MSNSAIRVPIKVTFIAGCGMTALTCNPRTQETEREDCTFQVSLGDTANLRIVCATPGGGGEGGREGVYRLEY